MKTQLSVLVGKQCQIKFQNNTNEATFGSILPRLLKSSAAGVGLYAWASPPKTPPG